MVVADVLRFWLPILYANKHQDREVHVVNMPVSVTVGTIRYVFT